jgi:hypothetical protein
MFDWIEICLAAATTTLLVCAFIPQLQTYRSLFWGGGVLMAITMLFPRPGNRLGQFLFAPTSGSMHLPSDSGARSRCRPGAAVMPTGRGGC